MESVINNFKKSLGLENEILGVFYVKDLPEKFEHFQDTACTALARAFITRKALVFGAKKYPQLCSGADYFLKLKKISDKETIDVYINKEKVFKNKKTCRKFLELFPRFPVSLKNKFILIKPLRKNEKPDIVILLINPAQSGRILGLLNYDQYKKAEILPSQPTCLSFFAPLITKNVHINFLDYYDRYYQGKVSGKNIFPDEKLILSMLYSDFRKVLNNLKKSPHGNFKPELSPVKIDPTGFKK